MLTSMTNSVMNVTYHHSNISTILPHRNTIRIHASNNLTTISSFGIDGNIDEKHLVPRMPTRLLIFLFKYSLSIILPIDICQCAFYQTVIPWCTLCQNSPNFHVVHISNMLFCMPNFSPIEINVKGFSNQLYYIKLCNNWFLLSSSVQRHYLKQHPTWFLDDSVH